MPQYRVTCYFNKFTALVEADNEADANDKGCRLAEESQPDVNNIEIEEEIED